MNPVDVVAFERRTGRIVASVRTCDPSDLRSADVDTLIGATANVQTQRVDLSTRTIVDLPPRTSEDHEFDYVAKVWRLDRERAAWRARFERDRRLTESDWTQLPDIPDATKLKWQAYRQALRDVTAQPGFPERIEWPTPP